MTLGEFEQLVLLGILRLDTSATAAALRDELQETAGRPVSRGALYATLERLERKGFVSWHAEAATPARGGVAGRRFVVSDAGLRALRRARSAVRALSQGLEQLLGES